MGYRMLITHGNGPQVGNLLIQQEEAKTLVPPQPLKIVGAMTQGQIGYMFQNTLRNYFKVKGKDVPVASVVTQVTVSPEDPDFNNPSKPIGPFYTKEEALKLQDEKGYTVKEVKPNGPRNWRRVVASPEPVSIVEIEAIRALLDARVIVIASGGGGVPVAIQPDGTVEGLAAVIDKDKAGNILSQAVNANVFMVLTDVENACINFGKPDQKAIGTIKLSEMRKLFTEGYFLSGSMGPKVEAAMRFVEAGGEKAIITSLFKAVDALEGKTGTIIIPD
jgi:carbamate kinase